MVNWTKIIVQMLIIFALFPILLFASAGRLDWWMGWAYVVIAVSITVIGRYLLIRRNPDLAKERAQALGREDTKGWDKILSPFVAIIAPLAQLIVAGLDMRYDWSPPFPLWLELVGIALMFAGYVFATWAMLTNPFYSSGVRIQTDRGQYVVQEGPYRFVRHPSYIGGIIGNLGTSLVLSSWWSLIPVAVGFVALVIRTRLEDETLHNELPGYPEYARHTRYRLIPGVW